jgi:exosortase A-associated hydrolase 1
MDKDMRRVIDFRCGGATLAGTLDEGRYTVGLLIVSGGNEIRVGAHRGMAQLGHVIATDGYPVFRFDRRGIGDSDGDNGNFASSGPDIQAAIATFRLHCPALTKIIAFGNCDAATALVLHDVDVDHLVLANPWVIETIDDLPPTAAIKDRYARRLRDPAAWKALVAGQLNIRSALKGLARIFAPVQEAKGLASKVAGELTNDKKPTTILLATGDNTAIAFADAWKSPAFHDARRRSNITVIEIASSSHSFANENDFAALVETLRATLTL